MIIGHVPALVSRSLGNLWTWLCVEISYSSFFGIYQDRP